MDLAKRLITVVVDQRREEGSATAVDRLRRAVGTYPAVATGPASTCRSPWAQAPGRPESAVRHPARPLHRHSVGVLPQELGFVSGMTCWRRLRDWNDAGVWTRLHENLRAELHAGGALDWSRAVIDGSHLRAMKGGPIRTEPGRPCPNCQTRRSKPLPPSAARHHCRDAERTTTQDTGLAKPRRGLR